MQGGCPDNDEDLTTNEDDIIWDKDVQTVLNPLILRGVDYFVNNDLKWLTFIIDIIKLMQAIDLVLIFLPFYIY